MRSVSDKGSTTTRNVSCGFVRFWTATKSTTGDSVGVDISVDLIEFISSYSAASGERVNVLGAGGRAFESPRPDQ